MRFFNTAGPCEPERHYMLPAAERLPQARRLIERGAYFVVHAPRQMGKTTTLRALADELTAEGRYAALYFTCEEGQPAGDDVEQAQLALLSAVRRRAARALAPELQPPQPWPEAPVLSLLGTGLAAWAQACPLPLVLFFDEIDALQGESLRSVLRQLRAGYAERPQDSPWSVALCGLRDVRDYKVASGGDPARLGTSSPFNIKVESLTLHDFTREQVAALCGQHTAETAQEFLPEAIDRVFTLSQGQPWLVNALAQQIVDVLVEDRRQPITAAPVDRARDILIERQDTHLDSLREPRIRALIEPMLAGTKLPEVPADDVRFAVDLGLVRMTQEGGLDVANPIYREIIVRELAFPVRAGLPAIAPTWLTEDGRLSTERLLEAFVAFWRQHGEPLIGGALPRDRAAPGADGLPAPGRERRRVDRARVRDRQRPDGSVRALPGRDPGDRAQGLARRSARSPEGGAGAAGRLSGRARARSGVARDLRPAERAAAARGEDATGRGEDRRREDGGRDPCLKRRSAVEIGSAVNSTTAARVALTPLALRAPRQGG
ncbi:AAA family ATPase [Sorangium sp. So ce1151]